MSAVNSHESSKIDATSKKETSTEKTEWCGHTINLGSVSALIGIVLIISGVALFILKAVLNLDLLYAGMFASLPGTLLIIFGLIIHGCLQFKDSDETVQNKEAPANLVVQPTNDQVQLSEDIETRAFFESKGIFGLPQELIDELTIWRRYRSSKDWDIELDAGFILEGPPGTGKTAISKCIAELLGGTYYERKCSDLMSINVGGTEQNITRLFTIAKDEFRVITIDEISGFLQKRRSTSHSQWHDGFTNHFLANMQGTGQTRPNFILIGTTNEFDSLDPALVRAGRLGQRFTIENPDKAARKQIFHYHLSKLKADEALLSQAEILADATEGLSGAEIVMGVIGAAKKTALLANRPMQHKDLLEKIKKCLQEKTASYSEESVNY